MSRWEFAKLQGLKYDPKDEDSTAILDAELEGFQSRPHEKPALAARNHLQYFIVKKGLNESTGEKKREISGKTRQQASTEEYEAIEDMIDNEEPIEKVPGRIKEGKQRKLTGDEKTRPRSRRRPTSGRPSSRAWASRSGKTSKRKRVTTLS